MKKLHFALLILFPFFTVSIFGQTEPVWPGTQTRFYPGIYPRTMSIDLTRGEVEEELDIWWGGRDLDKYREYHNGKRVSHVGLWIIISPKSIYSDYWYNHPEGPYDYAANCSNSEVLQNPDAVINGHAVYDWSVMEDILAIPEVANGEFKIGVQIRDQNMEYYHPKWWANQGMMTSSLKFPLKYDWIYTRCKMDYCKAFAARFAGNTAIALVQLNEYAGLKDEGSKCGKVVPGQAWQVSAENGTFFYPAKAMLEADPGLLVIKGNAAAFVTDYFEGRGSGLGLDDLPGTQGNLLADPKFFSKDCGSGDPCTVDCEQYDFGFFWLQQFAAFNHKDLVLAVSSQRNGWWVSGTGAEDSRTGTMNPWNLPEWPKEKDPWNGANPGGDPGGSTKDIFPDPAFWVWYTSGPPRAEGRKADSGLGQDGTDPCGVIPSHMYMPVRSYFPNAEATKGDKVAWNAENLSVEKYMKAFEIFGPSGTKAMFYFPDGYLEQFATHVQTVETVNDFSLYPNPAGSTTRLEFELKTGEMVNIAVFNLQGQKQLEVVNQKMTPGFYSLQFNTGNLKPGVYFCKMNTGRGKAMKKLLKISD